MTQITSSPTFASRNRQRDTVFQFVRFALVGVSNTIIDFSIYTLLTRFVLLFSEHIYFANTLSFAAAATWSYTVNRSWTFGKRTRASVGEAAKFYAATGSSFLINTAVLLLLVYEFGVYDLVAKVLAIAVSVVWNFALTKLWVFKT